MGHQSTIHEYLHYVNACGFFVFPPKFLLLILSKKYMTFEITYVKVENFYYSDQLIILIPTF